MADLLDRVHNELTARLAELRPLVEEHKRLEAALGALNEVQSATSRPRATSASAATGPRRQVGRNGAPASSRKRAPRGANREAVLRAVRERPGASTGEIAGVSGVGRNTLHALLARLIRDGELEKRALPSGSTGYVVTNPEDASQPEAT